MYVTHLALTLASNKYVQHCHARRTGSFSYGTKAAVKHVVKVIV